MKYLNIGLMLCIISLTASTAIAHDDHDHSQSASITDTMNNKSIYIDANFVMGKFEPKSHPDFVPIAAKYANRKGLYLQKSAYQAFTNMHADALKAGVQLQIRSASRNFNYQKGIWERKWTGQTKVSGQNLAKTQPNPVQRAKTILRYSSMPGSSRHHWGTDIDLNSFENSWFATGEGLKLYQWLQNNAANYGFCQVYTSKVQTARTGYEEEKWHWSYRPLAREYTTFAKKYINAQQFTGFKGAKVAADVHIVKDYVLGINPACF